MSLHICKQWNTAVLAVFKLVTMHSKDILGYLKLLSHVLQSKYVGHSVLVIPHLSIVGDRGLLAN